MYVYQMKYYDAYNALGQFFVDLCDTGPDGVFYAVNFPAPEFYTDVQPGRPSASIRIDGVDGEPDRDIQQFAKSVNNHRIELRVFHQYAIPGDEFVEGMDNAQYAQDKVALGSGVILDALFEDWTLGRLVRHSRLAGSIAGDAIDEQLGGERVYLHEMILTTF